jgi:dTDP-4-amino-4,6-dideoxy-D-glucose acyltransferase
MIDVSRERKLGAVGPGVMIHPTVQVFGEACVRVGRETRIDCFAVITAGPGVVEIGEWVHLSAGTMIFGTSGVRVDDGAALASRATILSTSDDFTSGHLGNAQVPAELRRVQAAPVVIERHVMVGAGAVILPGVRLGYGCAVGALSLVKQDVPPHTVVAGTPALEVGRRDPLQLARCEEAFKSLSRIQAH